jgi:tRNA modification GTPase
LDLGDEPTVCLVGPANAGKSALFAALTGALALVSPVAGTTRDPLEATWQIGGRTLRLIDTAGWLEAANGLEAEAVAAGRSTLAGAALIVVCSAADARCPTPLPRECDPQRTLVLATKADLGGIDERAVLAVSAQTGTGLAALAGLVSERLGGTASGEPRQQRLLLAADAALAPLGLDLPDDALLAEDLRRAAEALGELLGATTPDDVLEAIFSRFCIGK